MKKLIRVGRFFRILDGDNNLSISNIAAVLMIGKIMVTPALGANDIGLALVSLLPYVTKKYKKES